jgi:hypothetical protein
MFIHHSDYHAVFFTVEAGMHKRLHSFGFRVGEAVLCRVKTCRDPDERSARDEILQKGKVHSFEAGIFRNIMQPAHLRENL